MNKWLFCFQKSVAMVLAHLVTASEPAYSDQPTWMNNPGYPTPTSFKGLAAARKRSSFAESQTVRRFGESAVARSAFTTEDVSRSHQDAGPFGRVGGTFLDNRIHAPINGKSASKQIPAAQKVSSSSSSQQASTSFASSAILAMSPAIPIINRNLSTSSQDSAPYSEKLATSYKDPELEGHRDQFLIMHAQSVSPRSSRSEDMSPRPSDDHYSETDADDT